MDLQNAYDVASKFGIRHSNADGIEIDLLHDISFKLLVNIFCTPGINFNVKEVKSEYINQFNANLFIFI